MGPSPVFAVAVRRSFFHPLVLHEVWVLLADRWVYSTKVGVSCSMDNPWPVQPHPRAVPEATTPTPSCSLPPSWCWHASRGRVAGDEDFRVAVLVPLYNEDPDVVVRMLSALLHQSFPPAEIHVVDDGSTQSTYLEQRDWFIRQAAVAGIYATWQRTSNEGKRHAQVHGFKKIRDADLFVTVDSDSMLDAEALHEIVQLFSDPRVMSVAGVILAIGLLGFFRALLVLCFRVP